ncbi:unnamed protein product [Polarella glacialis]|uniref:Uncharacterized protein n=1 Tax=Polarella glacialis TaxID=89957 RepID=A0A813LPS0_POLGL|nr:unnamed protein product [Polarella glacialis]
MSAFGHIELVHHGVVIDLCWFAVVAGLMLLSMLFLLLMLLLLLVLGRYLWLLLQYLQCRLLLYCLFYRSLLCYMFVVYFSLSCTVLTLSVLRI